MATRKNIIESRVGDKILRAEIRQPEIDALKRLDMVTFKGSQGLGKYIVYRYVRKV